VAGNATNQTITATITDVADTDVTAPVLSSPTGTQTGATTATLTVSTDEGNGTLYGVLTLNSTPPSKAQIKAGQNASGAAAAYAFNQAVSTTGVQTKNATGLTASTTYFAFYMHEDGAGNQSNVPTVVSFTTIAGSAAFALIAHAAANGISTGATTVAINTTGANLLVVAISRYAPSPAPALSDSKGNTWTALTERASAGPAVRQYYCVGATVGTGHTFTVAGGESYSGIAVAAYSGAHATPFNVEAGGNGTGTVASAGSGVTPSNAGSLIVAAMTFDPTGTIAVSAISGGFTIDDNMPGSAAINEAIVHAHLIQTTAVAADPDWTIINGSPDWAASIAAFRVA